MQVQIQKKEQKITNFIVIIFAQFEIPFKIKKISSIGKSLIPSL